MDKFPVMEMFHSLQGEGYNSGMSSFFIRLGGCDVGCHWCDVKESWNAANHPNLSIEEIKTKINYPNIKNIVITGGEPCMYDLTELTNSLKQQEKYLMLETSGAYPIHGNFDWICVSPKKFKAPITEALTRANELKIIVYNSSDFKWAEQFADQVAGHCKLYLQPEYSKFNTIVNEMVDYIKINPQWRISLQTHKFMNIP
ncbi:MAG TPA: 7-carboxy-7-deazaguanine synthase QueE [Bacteroidia bacterium]|nr:7-carboxy-7-deazaguanine synthase QueE [Bacteroidia bacterium]HNT81017.1 7-carboxy-7-deazaguanine synthase QueE [Bacteroidia bacterium]